MYKKSIKTRFGSHESIILTQDADVGIVNDIDVHMGIMNR